MLVKLKNGSELQVKLIGAIMLSLESLLETKPIAFYELIALCKDHSHEVFTPEIMEDLKGLSLIQPNGLPHQAIQDVVLSAVIGNVMNFSLVSPVAPIPAE